MRPVVIAFAAIALAAVLVIGLLQAGGKDEPSANAPAFDLRAAQQRLRGAPPELAALHAQAAQLLGRERFAPTLAGLRGRPVVINKWASWCGPCRAEFPLFQQAGTERGKEIGFVGLNSTDNPGDARAFLRRRPVPYPSFQDPDEKLARKVQAAKVFPITVFLDRRGKVRYVHQGQYRSQADLDADLERYAR